MKYIYLWVVCLALAGYFLYQEYLKKHELAVVLKGLASLTFVALGFLSARMSADGQLAHNVISGLCLGSAADVMLNLRYVFKEKGKAVFLAGILIFLAGHVMYIIALIPKCGCLTVCLITGVILTALLIAWIFTKITAALSFRIFGVFYLGAIMIMTCLAFGILFTGPSVFSGIFAAGALFFLASDIILIFNTFGPEQKEGLRISNIILYYIGQLLIASSLQFI